MVEINPLVTTDDGTLLALDAKMSFDDNALFRRPQHRRAARQVAGGSARDQGDRPRPHLCRPRRQHRLHHQRRRPRHGDHGHDQACRRRARELPRHRRRRHAGAGGQGLQPGALRRQGGGDPGQHLRRHQPLRLGRPRASCRRCRRVEMQRAADGAPGRHPCRGGPRDPGVERLSHHHRRQPRRGGGEGRGRLAPDNASCSPGRKRHEHPSRRDDPRHRPGHHRQDRQLPRPGDDRTTAPTSWAA